MAGRWNYETEAYDPYELPDGASCYETDMRKKVSCAECGKRVEFGECYKCSDCGEVAFTHGSIPSYCPHCGAKVVDE